jgi:hypothetical protein
MLTDLELLADCILPPQTVSTFVCQGGQGKVQLSVNKDGHAKFSADRPVAYFGSSAYKKGVSSSSSSKHQT